jgi:gas vesicle protein
MNNYSKIGIAFLAGAAAGAIAGILLAPEKGTETRKKIADKAKNLKETVTEKVKGGFQKANEMKERFTKEAEEILA